MDSPHHEAHYPWNASPAADAPRSVFPASQHPLSAPSSYRRHQQAGVVRPGYAVVSYWHRDIPPFMTHKDSYAYTFFSSPMLLVVIILTKAGMICLHPSKTPLHKADNRTCGTLIWAITIWPTSPLRYVIIVIMLSTTMPILLGMSLHRHRSSR